MRVPRLMAALLLAAGMLLSGCSSLSPAADLAGQQAQDFYRAIATGDGSTACAALAHGTAAEIIQTADKPCSEAVLDEDLPTVGSVTRTRAFGTAAQVIMDRDVVFLTVESGRWMITAAGCTAQNDRPYRCSISGG